MPRLPLELDLFQMLNNDTDIGYSNRELLRDLLRWMHPYRYKFLFATFLRLTCDLAWLYPAYAIASTVDFFNTYQRGDSLEPIWWIVFIWILATLVRAINKDVAKYFAFQVAERMALDSQVEATAHLLRLDSKWHEKENSGNKLKRIQRGAEGINAIPRLWINAVVEIAVNCIGMTFIIGFVDATISAIIIVFFITYTFVSYFLTRKTARTSYAVNIAEEKLAGVSFETINNIRSVSVLGMGDSLLEIIRRRIDKVFEKIKLRIFWYRSRQIYLAMIGHAFHFIGLATIIWGLSNGKYEVGFLFLFIQYYMRLWVAIEEFSDITQQFMDARYGISRMIDILKEPVKINDDSNKQNAPDDWNTIHLKNISFAYGNHQVLKNLSFDIRRGEKLGIVGVSGAGKSTLFKLLLKEYEDYSGEITFDGLALKDIKKSSYFTKTAVVLQDTEVFNFSLRENIVIANMEKANDEALLQRSLEIAHVQDFMHKLPEGIETLIGEKGIKLSGGEKQRVGIARAIFKEPQVLFMDEATSHLDLESEEKIRDSLHKFFQTVTAVVIAHRLTTIREMDRILVLENGEIIESGTFDELYEKKGRFFELWEKQKF